MALCFSERVRCFSGSAQESVKTSRFERFCCFGLYRTRSRRRWGNVGTRVLCGFPSVVGIVGKSPFDFSTVPSTRHFHSEASKTAKTAPVRLQAGFGVGCGANQARFEKPRRMHIFTVSCAEPFFLSWSSLSKFVPVCTDLWGNALTKWNSYARGCGCCSVSFVEVSFPCFTGTKLVVPVYYPFP